MSGLLAGPRRRRGAISRDTKEATSVFVKRNTALSGIDLDRLDESELVDLVGLVAKVSDGIPNGHNFSRFSRKEQRQYEGLLEKAAGLARGTFAAERDAAVLRGKAESLARRARRVAIPTAERERSFLGRLGEDLRAGHIHAVDLCLLAAVAGALFNGEGFAPGSSISGSGDSLALTVDRRFGIVGADRDDDGLLARWEESLEWLGTRQYLDVRRDGPSYSIRLGPSTLKALR
jgi:hypothetical protein